MELKEFVRSTLLEIVEGVSEAQKALIEGGSTALINPGASQDLKRAIVDGRPMLQQVEFDVAVTVTETSEMGIGGRLSIVAASIGTQRGRSAESSEVSRVRFHVPITLAV